MINTRRVLLFLPLYIAWAVAVDLVMHWGDRTSTATAPTWMVIAFVASAVVVAVVVFWFLLRRARGEVPVQKQQTYTGILVGVIVAGVVEDLLKGLAFVVLGGRPWWAMVGVYAVGYAVMWAVLSFMLNRSRAGGAVAPKTDAAERHSGR